MKYFTPRYIPIIENDTIVMIPPVKKSFYQTNHSVPFGANHIYLEEIVYNSVKQEAE